MHTFKVEIEGKEFIIETGKMAKQATGSVTVQLGGTVVLVTVVCSKEPKEDKMDMLPLFVEYQERTYAAGKIPGGFFKREGRPSEKAILTSRLIDRPIRPLFPKGLRNEVQVVAMVISADGENDPDVLAMVGASAALSISEIPFSGPIGAVRVGLIDDTFIVNPTFTELENSPLDLVVVGNKKGVVMLESESNEVSEEKIIEAIDFGYQKLSKLIEAQEQMVKECGVKKASPQLKEIDEELRKKVKEAAASKLDEIYKLSQREQRQKARDLLLKELVEKLVTEESEISDKDAKAALTELEKKTVRSLILDKKRRVDGRSFKDIREISCEIGVLPRTHGSGLFTRGQTQSLTVTTLGTGTDEQLIDALEGEKFKSFMLHYNFPPFSVGEVKPMRGPGRRDIGHGALAERALRPVMPKKEGFPYTVRVVSDILESNGSSSMATVCGGTLSLMDAGVPIKAPVSGIAMGLVKEQDKFAILTDIGGVEDHLGDMDFKVAGTKDGITAIQLDLKIDGITPEIIQQTLKEAKEARLIILDKMLSVIATPKNDLSPYAPRIVTLQIKPEKIKDVIGPGGKVIRKITEETGVTIDIENDGTVQVASSDADGLSRAIDIINGITKEAEVGKIYQSTVKRIMDFGAFCEILPGKEGLVHVSELADKFVKKASDVVKVGDEFPVKVIEIDSLGRINLSRKQAQGTQEDKPHNPKSGKERKKQ
ncbi:MAG: polyribonucleotide nucleotidyltransferase [Candidatus Omnitrophica bacterium]|nr:polyribonucleotide nucleotidyltransferase [Candidatus Omnitrophota bacterium]